MDADQIISTIRSIARVKLGSKTYEGDRFRISPLNGEPEVYAQGVYRPLSDKELEQLAAQLPGAGSKVASDSQPRPASEVSLAPARPALSDKEIAEVNQYLHEDTPYYEVNDHLRSGGKLSGGALALQGAIQRASILDQPITVYRGLQVDDTKELLKQLKSGRFTDAGFMSTSTIPGGAFQGNVQLKIHARHGLDASHYGSNSNEFLLPAGSEFRVVSLRISGHRVEAELEQLVVPTD